VRALERELASRVRRARPARAIDHALELGAVTQQVAQRSPTDLVAARAEEVLGLLVQMQHRCLGVEPDDACDHAVEQVAELGRREARQRARLSGHANAFVRAAACRARSQTCG
jgi:hypothetical protein